MRTPTGCQMRIRKGFFLIFSHPIRVQLFSDLFRWFSLRFNHRLLSASPPGYLSPEAEQVQGFRVRCRHFAAVELCALRRAD